MNHNLIIKHIDNLISLIFHKYQNKKYPPNINIKTFEIDVT